VDTWQGDLLIPDDLIRNNQTNNLY